LGNIVSVSYVEVFEKVEQVYNFSVEGAHTYYVGESEVLVHNACKIPKLEYIKAPLLEEANKTGKVTY